MIKGERRGCIRLKDAFVGYDNEDDITFTITVDEKTFHLQSKNLDEREKWVSRIERTIRQHTASSAASSSSNSANTNVNFESSIDSAHKFKSLLHSAPVDTTLDYSSYDENNMSSNTSRLNKSDFLQFDTSLTESDAYLQLLIEQLKGLEVRKTNLLKDKSAFVDQATSPAANTDLNASTKEENPQGDQENTSEQDMESIDSVINATEVSLSGLIGHMWFSLTHFS